MKIKSILLTIMTVIALLACENESFTNIESQEEGSLLLVTNEWEMDSCFDGYICVSQ